MLQAVVNFITMQFQLCSVFFTFSLGTKSHYFGRTILHGGARVCSTIFFVEYLLFVINPVECYNNIPFPTSIKPQVEDLWSAILDFLKTTGFTPAAILSKGMYLSLSLSVHVCACLICYNCSIVLLSSD